MKTLFILSLTIVSALSACGPKITDEQAKKLDILSAQADSLYQSLVEIDSNKVIEITTGYEERRSLLLNDMKDTLSRETLFYLDSFLVMKKVARFFKNDFFQIRQEVKTITKQLDDLEKDVANRLVNENQFNDYYKLEKENFDQLLPITSQVSISYENMQKKYERMTPKVDSIINAYKAKVNE